MITYIIHTSLLIMVCFIFYRLFLQNETFFKWNRWFFTGSLLLVFIIPFIPVPGNLSLRDRMQQTDFIDNSNNASVNSNAGSSDVLPAQGAAKNVEVATVPRQTIPYKKILIYIYVAGVIVFFINLVVQLIVLLYQVFSLPYINKDGIRVVEMTGDKAPCSFGRCIFINPHKYDWDTYNQILAHEQVHIQQGHSIDLLLAELLLVVQWFNPFAWHFRKSMERNLEYLTDTAVLNREDIEKERYQLSLVRVSAPHMPLGITTNYNQSTLQKRIMMMNAKKSSVRTIWKYLVITPLLGIVTLIFNEPNASAQTVAATNDSTNVTSAAGLQLSGIWQLKENGHSYCIQLAALAGKGNYTKEACFKDSELSPLPKRKKTSFKITREAGILECKGEYDNQKGYGRYIFYESSDFKTFLTENGVKEVSPELLFFSFIININRAYIGYLQQNGYQQLTASGLQRMAMHDFTIDQVQHFISGLKALNYSNVPLEKLIELKIHQVTPEYIWAMQHAGYGGISLDDLIGARTVDVDSAYITQLKDIGYTGLPLNKLVQLRSLSIDAPFITAANNARDKKLSVDELVQSRIFPVDADNMQQITQLGYDKLSETDKNAIAQHKITAAYVSEINKWGFGRLTMLQIINAKLFNLTPDYIAMLKDRGYAVTSFDKLAELKINNIDQAFIDEMSSIGYKNISVDKLIKLKQLSITADFIKSYNAIGFKNISPDQATQLRIFNVSPEYILSQQKKEGRKRSLDAYLQLKTKPAT